MSVSDIPFPTSASDDIWHQNKAQIMNLYQNQRKTLKEVKRLMELKDFPEKPLSTWETKIRDVLQLRKKAKATNWPLIYRHILPRLENPGQKALRRRTAIYLKGSKIPWNKAWKEIRRSGAITLPLRQKSPSPLPPEITIRTPSPAPGPSTLTAQASQPACEVEATHFEHTAQDLVLRSNSRFSSTAQVVVGDDASRSLAQYAVSVYQDCAATIPWIDLYQVLQYLFHGADMAWRLDDNVFQGRREPSSLIIMNHVKQAHTFELDVKFQSFFDLLPDGCPVPPHPSHDLGYRVAISSARVQLHQFISTAMYLLSNNLHDPEDGDGGLELFCSILERDARQTIKLLNSRLPSIRAAWYHLLWYSAKSQRRDTFRLLIDIGIRNAWITSSGPIQDSLLLYAVEMECNDAVVNLVAYGRRSGFNWWMQGFEATVTAIRNDNNECARLLIEHCGFSTPAWRASSEHQQGVTQYLMDIICAIDAKSESDMRAIDFILKIGAKFDEPCWFTQLTYWGPMKWYCGKDIDRCLHPTTLDHAFYFDRLLYEKLTPYNKVSASEISRTGILLALKSGAAALQDYLVERVSAIPSYDWQRVNSYLEVILAEQFMLQYEFHRRYRGMRPTYYREIDLETVKGLIEYGVDLTLPSINVGIQDLMGAVLRQLSRHCTEDGVELITILMANGARITAPQLRMAVEHHGITVLECLAPLISDSPGKAVLALAEAARLNNLEAVEFLVRAGADPKSFVPGGEIGNPCYVKELSYSVQAIAAGDERGQGAGFAMIKYLAEHGASLVVTPNDSSPFDFTRHLMRCSSSDTFRKVKYAIQALRECNPSSALPPQLLESCLDLRPYYTKEQFKVGLEMFDYFLSQGASVSPGSCLTALVCAGAPQQLIEKVVRSGADVNAYRFSRLTPFTCKCTPLQAAARIGNEGLVRLLLIAGSEVNSRACGKSGSTALQAICAWDTATEEEYERKLRICQLLISHGADINAAPARMSGSTALQNAAKAGHLEVAALLLRNGARVNAPQAPSGVVTNNALDSAVAHLHLDMVKFLLNANALSTFRGTTGYDGAIELAERRGYFAIADLIRDHAAKNMALGLINPELLKPQEDYRTYGYLTDKVYRDINGEALFVSEHCTMESLCRYCSGIAPD